MRKTSHAQNKEPLLEHVLSRMRLLKVEKFIAKNSVVADLGCGYNGTFLKHLSSKIKLGIGYDVSVTKNGLPKNITLRKTDLNKSLDPTKNHFDTVTALAVLEHVTNPEKFIDNTKAMLKGNGTLIITTPHRRSKPILEFLSLRLGIISKEEIADHKNYFDELSIRKLMQKSGYKIVKLEAFEFGLNLLCIARKSN